MFLPLFFISFAAVSFPFRVLLCTHDRYFSLLVHHFYQLQQEDVYKRQSISATDAICPLLTFEPSRFGKFLVEWRIENALFAGTSPAPKHGPQNAVLTVAPVSMIFAMLPFLINSM